MFPLGSVLFPGMPLSLRIFEARYHVLLDAVLAGDGRFGVVLIEQGHEVGGGDRRSSWGTMAQIAGARRSAGGSVALVAVGLHRIRVTEWLADDPYPRAVVAEAPDEPSEVSAEHLAASTSRLRRLLARMAEAGAAGAPATFELSADPGPAVFELAAAGPFGPFDRQTLLAAPSAADRLDVFDALLSDLEAVADVRWPMGGSRAGG